MVAWPKTVISSEFCHREDTPHFSLGFFTLNRIVLPHSGRQKSNRSARQWTVFKTKTAKKYGRAKCPTEWGQACVGNWSAKITSIKSKIGQISRLRRQWFQKCHSENMKEKTTSLIPQYHAKEYAKEKFQRRVYIGCILVIVLVTWKIIYYKYHSHLSVERRPPEPKIVLIRGSLVVLKREKVSIYLFSVTLFLGFWK